MKLNADSNTGRLRVCYWLCMLCVLGSYVLQFVGMDTYEKIWFYTSDVQLAATLVFLILAVRSPAAPVGLWHLAFGVGFTGWLLVTKYMHALYGEPPEIVGLYMARYLVLLPFGELCADTRQCRGIKGAAILTWAVCLWLAVLSVLLLLDAVPQALSKYVLWSGARLSVLWNPIIYAMILFTGIVLCVAACFVWEKKWQRGVLLLCAVFQIVLIALTHSRTIMLSLCAFIVGVAFFAMGGGNLKKSLVWALAGIVLAGGIFLSTEAIYKANNQRLIAKISAELNAQTEKSENAGEESGDAAEEKSESTVKTIPQGWQEGATVWLDDQGYLTNGYTSQHSLKEDAGNLNGRMDTWKDIFEAFRESRDLQHFGTSRFRDRINPQIAHAHNSWLQMMVQMGLSGLLLALALTAEILIACARVLLRCRDRAKLVMTVWVICMLPVGFMEPFLFNVAYMGDLFILVSGYLWSWGRKEKQ